MKEKEFVDMLYAKKYEALKNIEMLKNLSTFQDGDELGPIKRDLKLRFENLRFGEINEIIAKYFDAAV